MNWWIVAMSALALGLGLLLGSLVNSCSDQEHTQWSCINRDINSKESKEPKE